MPNIRAHINRWLIHLFLSEDLPTQAEIDAAILEGFKNWPEHEV